MKFLRSVTIVLAAVTLSSATAVKPSASTGDNFELLILHNNDMHARFEQTSQLSGACTTDDREAGKCYGGFPRVAHVVKEARRAAQSGEGPPVLYLNAGDTYTGTAWFTIYKWKIAAEFINALQPDAVALSAVERGFTTMSHFATPFIVVNLGCEMVFVIEQRLKAQNISLDKAERVLTDIVTILLHSKLLEELFIPQPVAKHTVTKQLLQDISTTSIMKLDDYSMSKLWDLMTMIFKWQLTVGTNQNIFDISRRHLRSVAILMPHYFPKFIIEQAMKRFENLSQRFTDDDYLSLINTIIVWFSQYQTKISVLMRLGLQRKDGTFNSPASINPKIVNNLGENIYQYDDKKNSKDNYESHCLDTNEINCLLSSIEQVFNRSTVKLHLPIDIGNSHFEKKTLEIETNLQFENISINVKTKHTDLSFTPEVPKSPQDDLLKMLDEFSE